MLKHYLRVYCNYKQDNWSKLLSMMIFVYNNSVHSAIDKTLNVMLKEYIAIFANASESKISKEETSLIAERAQWLRNIKEHLRNLWERVSKQQIDYYNSNHTAMHFEVSSKIFLRSVNIRIMRFKKKIDHKQLRFFVILKRVNTQTYKLDLSIKYDAIHSIFHVSLLKSWHSRDSENFESQTIFVEEKEKWEMKKILNKRIKESELQYLVQWIDSSSYENFWKSLDYLRNAMKMMTKYEKNRSARRSIDRRDARNAKDAKRNAKDTFENNRTSSRVTKSSVEKKKKDKSRKQ